MYKVYYWMTGGNYCSRIFATLHDATMFTIYGVGYGNCGEIIKVK